MIIIYHYKQAFEGNYTQRLDEANKDFLKIIILTSYEPQ